MPFHRNGERARLRTSALVVGMALGCNCSDQSVTVCPKPPDETVPAAETVGVGGVATFAIPANQLTPNRRIHWGSDLPSVATVPIDSGRATAHAVGSAIITAVDVSSQVNCQDFWQGRLVVR